MGFTYLQPANVGGEINMFSDVTLSIVTMGEDGYTDAWDVRLQARHHFC